MVKSCFAPHNKLMFLFSTVNLCKYIKRKTTETVKRWQKIAVKKIERNKNGRYKDGGAVILILRSREEICIGTCLPRGVSET